MKFFLAVLLLLTVYYSDVAALSTGLPIGVPVTIKLVNKTLTLDGSHANLNATEYSTSNIGQVWILMKDSKDTIIVKNVKNGECLESQPDDNVFVDACNGEDNQKWNFEDNGYIIPITRPDMVLNIQSFRYNNAALGRIKSPYILKVFEVSLATETILTACRS